MQGKNDNLFGKIVKKDYNNELEKILEKKYFDENVKNILLNIFYKIEIAYKDYEKVKKDVEKKDEFIQKIIKQIKDNCETIKLIQPNSKENEIIGGKTFLVEKNKKRIICYPIERKLLYCISKISKNDKIVKDKYFLINETISNLINTGNNINTVEVIRDFNGYSWTTISREIESIKHNLIYQNLRILLGNRFLNKWIYNEEFIIDYIELLKERLISYYDEDLAIELFENLKKISFLLNVQYDKKFKNKVTTIKNEIENKLEQANDSKSFIERITKEKILLTKKIRNIDEIINDKKELQKEYIQRNELLPLNEKIFSVRILSKSMKEERKKYLKELEELNQLLNPQNFLNYKQELEEKEIYLKLLNKKSLSKEVESLILEFQKLFLNCYEQKLNNAKTKQDVIKMIYEFRYYCMIPYDKKNNISDLEILKESIEKIQKELIKKAGEMKIINVFSKKEELNYLMLKNIFKTRVINLEELCIKVTKEKEKLFVQLFDENIFEEKNEIANIKDVKNKDLEIRYNKKVRIFI